MNTRISHSQYYTLRQWTEANSEKLIPLTISAHTELANKAMTFNISEDSVGALRRELGWVKVTAATKNAHPYEELEKRVAALEKAIFRTTQTPSFKSELL